MHNIRYYSNIYTRMCLKRWKSRRLATGSEALTGGRGGYRAFGNRWQCLPETAFGWMYLARMWVRCASPTVDRVYQSLEEARPCPCLGVHRGHGGGRRQKQTPCGRPVIGRRTDQRLYRGTTVDRPKAPANHVAVVVTLLL